MCAYWSLVLHRFSDVCKYSIVGSSNTWCRVRPVTVKMCSCFWNSLVLTVCTSMLSIKLLGVQYHRFGGKVKCAHEQPGLCSDQPTWSVDLNAWKFIRVAVCYMYIHATNHEKRGDLFPSQKEQEKLSWLACQSHTKVQPGEGYVFGIYMHVYIYSSSICASYTHCSYSLWYMHTCMDA